MHQSRGSLARPLSGRRSARFGHSRSNTVCVPSTLHKKGYCGHAPDVVWNSTVTHLPPASSTSLCTAAAGQRSCNSWRPRAPASAATGTSAPEGKANQALADSCSRLGPGPEPLAASSAASAPASSSSPFIGGGTGRRQNFDGNTAVGCAAQAHRRPAQLQHRCLDNGFAQSTAPRRAAHRSVHLQTVVWRQPALGGQLGVGRAQVQDVRVGAHLPTKVQARQSRQAGGRLSC